MDHRRLTTSVIRGPGGPRAPGGGYENAKPHQKMKNWGGFYAYIGLSHAWRIAAPGGPTGTPGPLRGHTSNPTALLCRERTMTDDDNLTVMPVVPSTTAVSPGTPVERLPRLLLGRAGAWVLGRTR